MMEMEDLTATAKSLIADLSPQFPSSGLELAHWNKDDLNFTMLAGPSDSKVEFNIFTSETYLPMVQTYIMDSYSNSFLIQLLYLDG